VEVKDSVAAEAEAVEEVVVAEAVGDAVVVVGEVVVEGGEVEGVIEVMAVGVTEVAVEVERILLDTRMDILGTIMIGRITEDMDMIVVTLLHPLSHAHQDTTEHPMGTEAPCVVKNLSKFFFFVHK